MDFLSKAKQVVTARLETGSAAAASLRLSADGNSQESGDDDSLDTPRMTDAEFWTRFNDFEERVTRKIEGGLGNTQASNEVLLEMRREEAGRKRLADEEVELYEYLHHSLDLEALDKVSESIYTELQEEKKLTATAANADHHSGVGRATIDAPQDPAEVSSERAKILDEQKRQGALLETMRQEQEARHAAIRDEMKFLRSEVARLNLIVDRYEARDAERAALKEG